MSEALPEIVDPTDTRAPNAPTRGKLAPADRNHTIYDLWVFPTTRKMILLWTPVVLAVTALAIYYAQSPWTLVAGAVFGVMCYTFIEYCAHRYVYHWEPESRFWRAVTFDLGRNHMNHHRNPSKYGGGINAKQAPMLVITGIFTFNSIVFPLPTAFCLMAIAAGSLNYVAQEFVHFGTHHLPMNNRLMRYMKRHHMLHHYQDETTNYGLFWPVWDFVYGTTFDAKVRRRRTALAGTEGGATGSERPAAPPTPAE